MLKVLFLVQAQQRAILDRLYDGIASACQCDVRRLNKAQQKNLRSYLKNIDIGNYDFILLMTRVKYAMRQTHFLKKIPNLAFLEHDAWQNYVQTKYKGKFSIFYRALPNCTVISSGFEVSQKLRSEGINCHFVPKGYDQSNLSNLGLARDIECAFVGSTNHSTYDLRSAFLSELADEGHILITRTASGDDYLKTLNRIRFFVSADIGFGEYMLKNFEAMACGCLLFAYNQGESENQALGFQDMKNIVLYDNKEQLLEKMNLLSQQPEHAESISRAGQKLVESRYCFKFLGCRVVEVLNQQRSQLATSKNL